MEQINQKLYGKPYYWCRAVQTGDIGGMLEKIGEPGGMLERTWLCTDRTMPEECRKYTGIDKISTSLALGALIIYNVK